MFKSVYGNGYTSWCGNARHSFILRFLSYQFVVYKRLFYYASVNLSVSDILFSHILVFIFELNAF